MHEQTLFFVGSVQPFDKPFLERRDALGRYWAGCPSRAGSGQRLRGGHLHWHCPPSADRGRRSAEPVCPYCRKNCTTASRAVSAVKSSRAGAKTQMEVPASTKLQVSTTCCRLPSRSAGTRRST